MTQDEIIRMAREAGLVTETHGRDWIEAHEPDDCLIDFANLVAEATKAQPQGEWVDLIEAVRIATKEKAAKVCDEHDKQCTFKHGLGAAIRSMK
jgi:hypothetical protein